MQKTYNGNDLGCVYTKEKTRFRVWAPTAQKISVNLFLEGNGENFIKSIPMKKGKHGTFKLSIKEELEGIYYTYSVTVKGICREAVDPYAKATGVNGQRAMIIDMKQTNPKNWEKDQKPFFAKTTDAIIYELHIRDLSSRESSGISNKGKFLGLIENGSKNKDGLSTGLDHIKELGITHLHLLPIFDYASVDEEKEGQFNWGYDPQNYNVPEGSYATDPYNGKIRITELKEVIQRLHKNGIRVVMDVVYNHTAHTEDSNFNKIVPNYYYRKVGDSFSNASACGNETASEHKMMRKFLVESVTYWAKEYHIDGFRFDLMGIHDIKTMKKIRVSLNKIDKSILLYGEGWTGGESPLAEKKRAMKENINQMKGIAAFNDDIRDAIKGHVFEAKERGFVNGKEGLEEKIKFGVTGAVGHPEIPKEKAWAKKAEQSVNYVSAHDNLTLWDKLATSNAEDSIEERTAMNKLAAAIVMTSQGIPFFQAGEELLRSKMTGNAEKPFDENSYCSSDEVNAIHWEDKKNRASVFEYYKGLIALRKQYKAFRMTTKKEIVQNISFLKSNKKNTVGFLIQKKETILVFYNASKEEVQVPLSEGTWSIYANEKVAGIIPIKRLVEKSIKVPPIAAMILVKD